MQLIALNREHGYAFMTDLYAVERYGPQVTPGKLKFKVKQRRRIERLEASLHGERVWYQRLYDGEGLANIYRREGTRKGPLEHIVKIYGSHIHINSDSHFNTLDPNLGPSQLALGFEVLNYNGAFEALDRWVKIYRGELPPPSYEGYRLPPPELALPAFQAYMEGFRERAVELGKTEISPQIDRLLERL